VATQPAAQPDAQRVRTLAKESADLREQLAVANAKVAELSGLTAEIDKLQGRLDQLRQEHAAKAAGLEAATAEERKARQEQAKQLDAAKLRVAELETAQRVLQTASAEGAEAKKQAADLKQRLAAAGEELTRRRKAEEAAEAKLAETRQESQRLELRHREIVEAFQRMYLASVAPGQSGLEARKTAVRARQMIQRLASLSGEVKSDRTRQLLDRLEAVLTRLDLMNADRPDSRESFSRLVIQGDLERQIDAALAAPGQAEDVKNWLFEAKLILMGGSNAG
jgi:chromosome segregation ATPase